MNWWRSRIPPEEDRQDLDSPAHNRQSEQTLQARRSDGEPLDTAARQKLEASFGADLSDVRIHRDEEAIQSATGLGADAYTRGRDIYFAAGKYGERLLAHEVAHTIQQSGAAERVGPENGSLETEAERASMRFLSGEPAGLSGAHAAPAIQRQKTPGATGLLSGEDRPFHLMPSESATLDDFETDKSTLKPDHRKTLDELATKLIDLFASSPDSFVSVTGHTDAVGAEDHNKALGQSRSDAVRDYLIARGVPADTMHAGSLGETALKVETKQPDARNRRVEIDIHRRSFRPKLNLLTPPSMLDPSKPPQKPPDLIPKAPAHVPTEEEEAEENIRRNEERWKKAQEIKKKEAEEAERHPPGSSLSDFFGNKAREVAKSLGLPKWIQDKAEDFARDLPAKGLQAIFDQVTADKNLDDNTKDAVKNVLKALPQVKAK